MPLDPAYLRQHYASLSDAALLALDRSELVEMAQQIYDEEVQRRELGAGPKVRRATPAAGVVRQSEPDEEQDVEPAGEDEGDLDWLEDAAEVYTTYDVPGTHPGPQAVSAEEALRAAGIPCHLEFYEDPEADEDTPKSQRHRWRILAPGKLSQYATSVLDRDIFNLEFEEQWRNHLEILSDEELREMEPEVAFCGLYDRIERINNAYGEELARRRMKR
jgi:hypothetical protein